MSSAQTTSDPMKVRVGIGAGPSRDDPAAATLELVDGCEARGIDSVWFPDRIAAPAIEPLVAMGWAVARTSSLKVGSGVIVLPGRNPAVVAAQLASLAALAPKRILPVFGLRPATAAERTAYPVAGPRAAVFEEALTVVRRLLTEESVTFHGSFFTLDDAVVAPRPARPLDLWLGGLVPAALRRVGRLADGWLASFVTPAEAGEARRTIAAAADEAGREVEDDHYGTNLLVLPPETSAEDADRARVLRAPPSRDRPGRAPRRRLGRRAPTGAAVRRRGHHEVRRPPGRRAGRRGRGSSTSSPSTSSRSRRSVTATRSRWRVGGSHDAGERDLQDHTPRVLPRDAVALGVAVLAVDHRLGIVPDHRQPLERRPPAAVDLADRDPRAAAPRRAHLAGLGAGTRRDDPGDRGVQVEGDADGHDVRRPVAAQGRQRAEVVSDQNCANSSPRACRSAGVTVTDADGALPCARSPALRRRR